MNSTGRERAFSLQTAIFKATTGIEPVERAGRGCSGNFLQIWDNGTLLVRIASWPLRAARDAAWLAGWAWALSRVPLIDGRAEW